MNAPRFITVAFAGASFLGVLMGLSLADASLAEQDRDRQEIIAQQAYAARMAEAGK